MSWLHKHFIHFKKFAIFVTISGTSLNDRHLVFDTGKDDVILTWILTKVLTIAMPGSTMKYFFKASFKPTHTLTLNIDSYKRHLWDVFFDLLRFIRNENSFGKKTCFPVSEISTVTLVGK